MNDINEQSASAAIYDEEEQKQVTNLIWQKAGSIADCRRTFSCPDLLYTFCHSLHSSAARARQANNVQQPWLD